MTDIRAIVTDIEGTTSSISFVKDVLFPFARERLPAFIETHGDRPEVQHWLHEAAKEAGLIEASRQEIIDLLIGWIDADRKSTALKALQGMIWQEGYASGAFRSHVYPEVPAKLRDWHARGLRLFVYSSGSVPSQKLFFGHSDAGDLLPLFEGHFDTETGAKRETASYRKIASAIGEAPEHILFLSDIIEELDVAREAGFNTAWLVRLPVTDTPAHHTAFADFNALPV